MPDLFYVVRLGRSYLSVLADDRYVKSIEDARYFPNLESAEKYVIRAHSRLGKNCPKLVVFEVSLTEA